MKKTSSKHKAYVLQLYTHLDEEYGKAYFRWRWQRAVANWILKKARYD